MPIKNLFLGISTVFVEIRVYSCPSCNKYYCILIKKALAYVISMQSKEFR